jgi:thiosulfate sulfurtransferase
LRTIVGSFVLFVAVLVGSSGALGAPALYIQEEVFDFGVAVDGDVVDFAFLLENHGDEVLVIESVGASCGCTTTALSAQEIEPGEIVRLGGELDTTGAGGSQLSKWVYVNTNDPERPNVKLRIVGRVVEEKAFLVDAEELSGDLMILVDVRDPVSYAIGHLPGAVSLPEDSADIWLQVLPKDVRIVLCDQSGDVSTRLAERMLSLGFLRVEVLFGGLDEWVRRYGDRMLVTLSLMLAPSQI